MQSTTAIRFQNVDIRAEKGADDEKWSRPVRFAIAIVGAVGSWGLVFAVLNQFLD